LRKKKASGDEIREKDKDKGKGKRKKSSLNQQKLTVSYEDIKFTEDAQLEEVMLAERPVTARPIVELKHLKEFSNSGELKKKNRTRSKTNTSPFRNSRKNAEEIFLS